MKARTTERMEADQAEHDLILTNAAAYARAVELDPNFRSVASQALPDRYYIVAQRHVANGLWTQARATAWLQTKITARNLADIGAEPVKGAEPMARADAALHTALKSGGMATLALACLWCATDPGNVAIAAAFAACLVGFRVCAALLTRSVI